MQTQPPPRTLYAHTVQAVLADSIHEPRTEYLVEDLRTHEILADTFAHPETPIPVGSLLKPFLVFAHRGAFPTVRCEGHRTGCWRAAGHGSLTLVPALAASCNTYFLTLAATGEDLNQLEFLGLPAPPPAAEPRDLIGFTARWPVAPLILAEAYSLLIPRASPQLLSGLRASAAHGTASAVGLHSGGVLAKTGTAPCLSRPGEPCQATGDGLTVVLAPALHPTTLILVRRRATTGAVTARTAGRIFTTLESLHAP